MNAKKKKPAAWLEALLRRALLIDEAAIAAAIAALAAVQRDPPPGPVGEAVRRGVPAALPNPWQVALGVLRLQHRLLTRTNTVGRQRAPRLPGWAPWLLEHPVARAPLLWWEGSVVPGDLSGLRSSPTTLVRHLLGTFHAGREANFDLELLAARSPSTLTTLRALCVDVIADHHPRAARWRRLCVYAGAHEALLAQVDAALQGRFLGVDHDPFDDADSGAASDDADVSFFASLRFCARQPADAEATWAAWRAGRFDVRRGLIDDDERDDDDDDDRDAIGAGP